MVWDAGAVPVVVLNRSDLCEDAAAAAEQKRLRKRLGQGQKAIYQDRNRG
jgi:putative ribosome biogenesis GTPase RsgA